MILEKIRFPLTPKHPQLTDSPPEDLQSIVSPEQCFNRKYSNEPGGFNVPRRSARLLRRSAPVSGSNTQLSERTPVLRRSVRLSGGEPTFPGLSSDNKFPGMPSRSVSGSSYTAKRTSVSLDASNITPKTFSGTSKKFNTSAKSYTGSVFSSTSTKTHQPFSPIKVSLNNIQGSSVPEDDLILGTPPTLLGSFSAATPTFVAVSSGVSGVGSETKSSHGSEDRKSRRSEEIHSDTTRQDAPHLDTSRRDTSRLDMSQLDNSIDAIPDCTANLTELFTTRDITRLDMSLGVNELDNNFCKQLAAQSPNPNLLLNESEGVTAEVIPNRADENSSYVLDESEWSKNGSVCMNDTTHITYITQNSSTSFLPGNTSCQIDTDTSRTDYPKFVLPAIPPEVILSTSERRKIFPDFPSLSAENTPTNSARSSSSSLQSQFTLLTTDSPSSNQSELLSGLSSQSGSTNTLVASSSTQSGSTTTLLAGSCPSSSVVDISSEPSGLRSPPEVERVVTQASRNNLMRQSIDAKLSQFSEWIDSSTKTLAENTEASQTPGFTNRMVSRLSGEVSKPTGPGTPLNLPEQHRTGSKEAVVVNSATNSSDSTVSTNSDTNLTPSGHVVQDDQISSTVPGSPNKENTVPTTRRTPKSSQELDTTKINITPRTKISKGFTKNLANQWENMNRDDAESSTARKARKTRIPIRTTSTRSINTTGSSPPRRPQRAAKSRPQLDDEKPVSRKRPTVARATSAKTSDKPNRPISRTKSDNLGKSNTSTRPAWRF